MASIQWQFSKEVLKSTPSMQDGMDVEKERKFRRDGARLIMQVGTLLGLPHDSFATGVVLFQRFYMFHSFDQFHKYIIATACLFLAGKIEETPKKCRDVVKAAREYLNESKEQDPFHDDGKADVIVAERVLLQSVKFDLTIEHPYKFVVSYGKVLKTDKSKWEKVMRMAWAFVNDSFLTTLPLEWEPEIIAIACIYLAIQLGKTQISDFDNRTKKDEKWWDQFVENVTTDVLDDMCHQILDVYDNKSTEDGTNSGTSSEVRKTSPSTAQENHLTKLTKPSPPQPEMTPAKPPPPPPSVQKPPPPPEKTKAQSDSRSSAVTSSLTTHIPLSAGVTKTEASPSAALYSFYSAPGGVQQQQQQFNASAQNTTVFPPASVTPLAAQYQQYAMQIAPQNLIPNQQTVLSTAQPTISSVMPVSSMPPMQGQAARQFVRQNFNPSALQTPAGFSDAQSNYSISQNIYNANVGVPSPSSSYHSSSTDMSASLQNAQQIYSSNAAPYASAPVRPYTQYNRNFLRDASDMQPYRSDRSDSKPRQSYRQGMRRNY